jgi:hypothetical protein
VHTEHGCANVNRFDACLCSDQRTYSATAERVVANNKLLNRNSASVAKSLKNCLANGVSRISLVGIYLDDYTMMDHGLVLAVMFASMVGVNCVSHISRDQQTVSNGSKVIFMSLCSEALGDPGRDFIAHVAIGTLG